MLRTQALYRAPVSMSAMVALAPTIFKSVGASTHGLWQISHICINFQRNYTKNVTKPVIPWQKVILSTHSLKFLTGALVHHKIWRSKPA